MSIRRLIAYEWSDQSALCVCVGVGESGLAGHAFDFSSIWLSGFLSACEGSCHPDDANPLVDEGMEDGEGWPVVELSMASPMPTSATVRPIPDLYRIKFGLTSSAKSASLLC